MDRSIVWYLAGPMRGLPQCNFPQFIEAARILRELGYTIKSPAEMDSPATLAEAMSCVAGEDRATYGGETPGQILSRDVLEVADHVGGVIFLPDWWRSRGAKLEAHVALDNNKQFAFFWPKGSYDSSTDTVIDTNLIQEVVPQVIRAALRRWI